MSKARDHHFIPVFYLKQWANEDGKLIEYSRPYRSKIVAKRVGPRATGFVTDLYSFPQCPPAIAQYLESVFLARTDFLASVALSKHLSGAREPWTPELRSAWSRFTVNFLIRHPDPFAEIKAVTHDNWLQPDNVTQAEYERLRRPEDPATFEEWVLLQGDNLADKIRIRFLQAAMDNAGIGARVNAMAWNVLDVSRARVRLLTSDWPLYRAFNGERMFLALPISPTVLFTAVTHDDISERLRATPSNELVTEMNRSVVSSARLYVYSADASQERFIANRMSSSMQMPPFFPSLKRASPSDGDDHRLRLITRISRALAVQERAAGRTDGSLSLGALCDPSYFLNLPLITFSCSSGFSL
jgi:Protein of unknown function (DUF4238)